MENNSGIINNGGQINATNMATGTGATIHYSGAGAEELKQVSILLDQLLTQLQHTSETVEKKDDLVQAITSLKEEVHKPSPGKLTMKAIGGTILDSLKYVSTLAPIAQQLWHSISAFIA